MGLTTTQILLIIGMLITGSCNTLTKSLAYDVKSPGKHGHEHEFKKPW